MSITQCEQYAAQKAITVADRGSLYIYSSTHSTTQKVQHL